MTIFSSQSDVLSRTVRGNDASPARVRACEPIDNCVFSGEVASVTTAPPAVATCGVRILIALLITLPFGILAADRSAIPPAKTPVQPEKGSVDPSGKFVPPPSNSRQGQPVGKPTVPESAIKVLPDGHLKIGEVILNHVARTVTIPARVNQQDGPVEYVLVMDSGKTHESIFATRATAEHIHIACLLLGMNAAQLTDALPPASAVEIEVVWESNGPERRVKLADCIVLTSEPSTRDKPKTVSPGPWFYAGSRLDYAGFAATREGSIISVINDGAALIINPFPDRVNDDIHAANGTVLPRKGQPVRIILTLPATTSAELPKRTQPSKPQ